MIQTTLSFFLLIVIASISNCYSAYIPLPVYTYHDGGEFSSYSSPSRTPSITSTSSNILRTPGNLGQISTYHKTIDTPYSSVRKADVRISNDALAYSSYPSAVHLATPLHVPTAIHPVHPAPVAIAYSAAPAVTHLTFDGFGTHYAW